MTASTVCGCTPRALRSGRGEQHSGSATAEWVEAVHSTLTSLPRDIAERADRVNAVARASRAPSSVRCMFGGLRHPSVGVQGDPLASGQAGRSGTIARDRVGLYATDLARQNMLTRGPVQSLNQVESQSPMMPARPDAESLRRDGTAESAPCHDS